MTNTVESLFEIIKDLHNRIRNLELSTYVYGNQPDTPPATMTPTGITGTITYYLEPITGIPKASITWAWTAPAGESGDPVVDYRVSLTRSTDTEVAPYAGTNGLTSVVTSGLPVGINQTLRVYAVSEKGVEGPVAIKTVTITNNSTPPPQPSTPTIISGIKSVVVSTDGKDSSNNAMPTDVLYYNVHAATGVSDTFTPTDANLFTTMQPVGSVVIPANANYDVIYVRLVAVNSSKLTSSPSTGVHATPIKNVVTDLDVVLPGSKAYSDINNLVIDGSFEDATTFSKRTTRAGTWSLDTGVGMPYVGASALKLVGDATSSKFIHLHNDSYGGQLVNLTVVPLSKYYISMMVRNISANGTFAITVLWYKQNGTAASTASSTSTAWTMNANGIYNLHEFAVQAPSDAVKAGVYITTTGVSTGTVWFDGFRINGVVGSVLIEDAAITNAKIADLAVNSAKIAEVAAGKITTGELNATTVVSAGPVNSSHVEMSASGVRAFVKEPTDASPVENIRMGTAGNESFVVFKDAKPVAAIDRAGRGMFSGISVPVKEYDANGNLVRGLTVYGTEFSEWINPLSKGLLAYGSLDHYYDVGTTAEKVEQVTVYLTNTRLYKISSHGRYYLSDPSALGEIGIRLALGTRVYTTSTDIRTSGFVAGYYYHPTYHIEGLFRPATSGYYSIALVARCLPNSNSWYLSIDEFSDLMVEDVGWAINNTVVAPNETDTSKRNYVSTWEATNSATYNGSNVLRATPNLEQGYVGGPNGDQHSLVLFTSNAVEGESTKTVASALTGATITKAEVYLYANYWYNNTGGTAVIRANTLTALATTAPTGTAKSVPAWPKPSGQWVDITSIFTSSMRGIWIGKSASSDVLYSGSFDNHSSTVNKPKLRLNYTR